MVISLMGQLLLKSRENAFFAAFSRSNFIFLVQISA
jgi:hypothetical protein